MPLLVAGALSTLRASTVEDSRLSEIRQVPVRTLDSILAEVGFARVDFLSVDVEGAELAVLRGLSIERYRPRLILIEDDVPSQSIAISVRAATSSCAEPHWTIGMYRSGRRFRLRRSVAGSSFASSISGRGCDA